MMKSLKTMFLQIVLAMLMMNQEGFSFRCGGIIFNRQHFHHHHHQQQYQHLTTAVTPNVRLMTSGGTLILSAVGPSDLDFGDEDSEPEMMLDDEEPEETSFADEDDEDETVDDDEIDVDDEDDTSEGGAEKEGLWQERRLTKKEGLERKTLALRSKLTWEEKYEDDPLRSDTPARDFEPEVDGYQHTFVAVGDIISTTQRHHAWVHHMQWARRTALLPEVDAKVIWEYTRLTQDCMSPAGQVLAIRANSSDVARSLLNSEPLQVTGGVRDWQLFEFHQFEHENTTCDLHDPRMFLGFDIDNSGVHDDSSLVNRHHKYHLSGGNTETDHPAAPRVVMMGRLLSCDDKQPSRGSLVLFNAKTNADSERYISADPMHGLFDKQKSTISVVNEQDVDGMNHLMARTFGEKTVLDQVTSRWGLSTVLSAASCTLIFCCLMFRRD